MLHLLLGGTVVVALVAAFLLRRSRLGRVRLGPLQALGVATLALAVPLAATLWLRPGTPTPGPPPKQPLPPGSYPTDPLAAGAEAPAVMAEGWLNGPPSADWPGTGLVVLDLWALW
jgi:hypothetical protein